VSVAGFSATNKKSVFIHAGLPIGVLSSPDLSYIESKAGTSVPLTATLVDAYGNTTTDASSFRATFTIPEGYRSYLKFADGNYVQTVSFSGGVAMAQAVLTSYPGKAYVVVEVSPDLANNVFTYLDDNGKEAQFHGYGKNLFQIRTYYAFNKEKLDNMAYNSLYTLLLGADYGNVTETNYLGGAMLFSSGSLALGASSLLAHPSQKTSLFQVYPSGKFVINEQSSSDLLGSSVSFHGALVNVDFLDGVQNEVLATQQINTSGIANRTACNYASASDIHSCAREGESEFVFLGGMAGYTAQLQNSTLSLIKDGTPIVSFGDDGVWKVQSGVKFIADTQSDNGYLGISVEVG